MMAVAVSDSLAAAMSDSCNYYQVARLCGLSRVSTRLVLLLGHSLSVHVTFLAQLLSDLASEFSPQLRDKIWEWPGKCC